MGDDLLRLHQSVSAMGATFSIVLYGRDRDRMEAAVRAAFEEVRRLDALLSNHRPESEWSRVNQRAGHEAVAVSEELFQLLAVCLEQSRRTEGAFDITIGPLKRAWGFFGRGGRVPTAGEIAAARRHVGYELVRLDAATRTVRFDHPGVEIDPGGVGKGYAVDRVVEMLLRHDVDSALVAGSASSLYGLGVPPAERRGWRVRVAEPDRRHTRLADLFLRDTSLSTSGTGEKCFWSDGILYSHVFDPRTGQPLQARGQVCVMSPSAVDGEVWAKACLVNGAAWTAGRTPETLTVTFCEAGGPAAAK